MKTNELYVSQDFHENVYVEAPESNIGQAHQNASQEPSEKPQERIVKTLSTNRYRITAILCCVIVFTGFGLAIAALVRAGNEHIIEEKTDDLPQMQAQLDELKEETNQLKIASNEQKMRIEELEDEQLYLESCEDLLNFPNFNSGWYTISPRNRFYQFEVYCNISNGNAETLFYHNFPDEVEAEFCYSSRCAKYSIRYEVKLAFITALIDQSTSCRQFVKYRCLNSQLFGAPGSQTYSAWLSRDGTAQIYWGGATSRRNRYCACGESETCAKNTPLKCNCDAKDETENIDEGFLTEKEKLPVTGLQFGDLYYYEKGWFTLGPLICSGRNN